MRLHARAGRVVDVLGLVNEKSEARGSQARRVHFPALDAVRTLACLLVLVDHLGGALLAPRMAGWNAYLRAAASLVLVNGDGGVHVFFVLSGYLITYLLLTEHALFGHIGLWRFYLRRVLRIWPMFYGVLALGFVVIPFARGALTGHATPVVEDPVAYALFFGNVDAVKSLGAGDLSPALSATWSIAVEEQFYAVWPLLLFVAAPRGKVLHVLAAVLAGSVLFTALATDPGELYFGSIPNFVPLSVGALAACVTLRHREPLRSFFGRVSRRLRTVVYAVCLGGLVGVSALALGPHALVLRDGAQALVATAFILEQMTADAPLVRIGDVSPLARFAKYTYSAYLLHLPVDFALRVALGQIHLGPESLGASLLVGAAAFALTLVAAYAAYHAVEARFIALKHRFQRVVT